MDAKTDVMPRLAELLRKVLRNPGLVIDDSTVAADVVGWDSLNHLNLMMTIEREFKVKFTTREIAGLKNVGELRRTLTEKLGGRI